MSIISKNRRGMKPFSCLLAGLMAFGAAMSAQAAGFWKGTGQDSGNADNWSNGQALMHGDFK